MFNKNNDDHNPFEVGKKSKTNKSGQFQSRVVETPNHSEPVNVPVQPSEPSKPNEFGNRASQRNEPQQPKRSANKAILSLLIFGGLVITNLPYDAIFNSSPDVEEISFEDFNFDFDDSDVDVLDNTKLDLTDVVVEDYNYSPDDLIIRDDINPFPIEIPKGEKFVIASDDERFTPSDFGGEIALKVGTDIKPGVYTVDYTNYSYLRISGTYDFLNAEGDGLYYNIPLIAGDVVELTAFDYGEEDADEFVQTFTPQTEYVEYQEGYAGVFVYGLSNFDSQVSLAADDYEIARYEYYNPEYDSMEESFYNDESVTFYGVPGSYFIISHPYADF
ncbi:hypothetical protein RZE82_07400 [Mollicutes bacterium LVI A0039]|nr:hypothetical protein RZE82_07400 [Mollicutes bacterium LVI A0039]